MKETRSTPRLISPVKEVSEEDFIVRQTLDEVVFGGIPLDQIVNLGLLNPKRKNSQSYNDFKDADQLEFWLIKEFNQKKALPSLTTLLSKFSTCPDELLGKRILGLINAIDSALHFSEYHFMTVSGEGWKHIATSLYPYFELVTERHPQQNPSPDLLRAWWHLAFLIFNTNYGKRDVVLPKEILESLKLSASQHLGRMRAMLRDDPTACDFEFYDKAYSVVRTFCSPWEVLRPLLLAFSEMSVQAVSSDLRYWPESNKEALPPDYHRVPLWIGSTLYAENLEQDLSEDQSLISIREKFALFCLERLKTRKEGGKPSKTLAKPKDDDFIEKRVWWRRCYVNALAELRVNPGGRAHRTLFWLSEHDPDEEVRSLAKKAHKQLRHLNAKGGNLDLGASPRRPLFAAFWWLRQAHLLHLGVNIDDKGAQSTRMKELRRTKERSD